MYLSSPARMRLALGPGSAVLILGPAVRVLVVMGSSDESSASGQMSVTSCKGQLRSLASERHFCCLLAKQLSGLRPEGTFHREDRKLVASKKAGTYLRRQHCQVTPRAAKLVQPA